MLHGLDPRIWRRLKTELMALGKLRSVDGLLTANGVTGQMEVQPGYIRVIGMASNG